MKTKKINFLAIAFALLMGVSFTSCLDSNNDNNNNYDWAGYVTVKQSMGSPYMLGDDGILYYPTNPDVLKITSATGSGSYVERAMVLLKYVDNTGTKAGGGRSVTIVRGSSVPTKDLCDQPDTIKTTIPLQNLNYAQGVKDYITVDFYFNYFPGTNFSFDLYPEKVQDDLLTLRLKQTYGKENYGNTQEYVVSYRIPYFQKLQSQLEELGLSTLTPKNDSIYVKILGTGANNSDLTISGPYSKEKFRIHINN